MAEDTPRRTVLAAVGWGAVTLGVGACTGPADAPPPTPRPGAADCVLTPESSEGPFYVDLDLLRPDITEGKPGVPLTLRTTVVDAGSCAPVTDAAVDIWHADADGVYSGFAAGQGERFLRGVQRTDSSGVARFATIVPGWYSSRTAHIHVKVHVGDDAVHTGQLYFADDLIDEVAAIEPYARRRAQRTTNDADSLFARGGRESTLHATGSPTAGFAATIILGVRA